MYKFADKDHKTVNDLSVGVFNIHPGMWRWKDYQDWVAAGGVTEPFEDARTVLNNSLQEVDNEIQTADSATFTYNGHSYYPDTEFIQGIFSVLPLLPADYTETWKTAEKQADGVNNVYVILDKAGIQGLALAYLQFKKGNWKTGEAKKQALKDKFLAGR